MAITTNISSGLQQTSGISLDGGLQVTGSNNVINLATGSAASQEPTSQDSTEAQSNFCGAEFRVSTHTCNSLHPAITVAPNGKRLVVWHDTRNGNFEIYGRVLPSQLPPLVQQEIQRKAGQLDPLTGERITEISSCSGYSAGAGGPTSPSGLIVLDDRCSSGDVAGDEASEGIVARLAAGRLDVNAASQVVILTAGDGATDFAAMGVQPNYRVRIETGANAGKEFFVQELLSPGVVDLTFIPSAVSDNNFVFSVFKTDDECPATECEFRITCTESASLFADAVSDSNGRFHVVWQDDEGEKGRFDLYYAQIASKSIGLSRGCEGSLANANQGGFPEVEPTLGSVAVTVGGVIRYFQASGSSGQFFTYGNRFLPTPVPNRSGELTARTGIHRLFRDFFQGGGQWTGVSMADDRDAWQAQIDASGSPSVSPPVVIPGGHPLAGQGDFGDRLSFDNVAFMIQAPPDKTVLVRRIALPILFKCAPAVPAGTTQPRIQDLVEAPKRPLPPSFIDPVDISRLLASPRVRIDPALPARFTLDDDATGTIYTNLMLDGPAGDYSRLVFQKPDRDDYKFILGQYSCGQGPCALRVPPKAGFSDAPDRQYGVTLEVWRGSDYRLDDSQVESAQMTGRLLLRKEFKFDPGENIATFSFRDGELRLPAGAMCFITAKPTDDAISFSVLAVGQGHVIWSTSGSGVFDQYYSPFTVPPSMGLDAPVYYEGRLVEPSGSDIDDPVDVAVEISFPTAGNFLRKVGVGFSNMIGVATNPITNMVIVSHNYPTGKPNNFSQIAADGTTTQWSSVSGLTDEIMLHVVQRDVGGFERGTLFCGNGIPGQVIKISPDGEAVTNPWATLPGETGLLRGGVTLDYVGVFGNALVVITSSGGVWKVTSSGAATRLASLGTHLEGVVVVPKDVNKYGPWSGKILAGAENQGLFWTIADDGATASYDLGIRPESIAIVEENQNFYMVDFAGRTVYGSGPEPFIDVVGDIAVSQEFPGLLYIVKWTGERFVTKLIATVSHSEQITFSTAGLGFIQPSSGGCSNQYIMSVPFRLTTRTSNEHARLARDPDNNVWMAWHSDRTGSNEVYVSKYFGECGVWGMPTMGGSETRLTAAGGRGGEAKFPAIVVDDEGEVHVAFMANDTPDGRWEIYYVQSTGGGAQFLAPVRVTTSPGDAMMPDIAMTRDGGSKRAHIVWHDSRFGDFEIMYATKISGTWRSSGQGGVDTRVTSAGGESLFPRLSADKDGNLRVVYHDARLGQNKAAIFMSSFSSLTNKWISSGQDGTDRITSSGPRNSLFPDIDQDRTGGVAMAWHDDRHVLEDPDQHEEVYSNYCQRLGQAEGHFPPLTTNVETKLDVSFEIVDCVDFQPIELTNVPEVCLKVRSPGATFLRSRNEDGRFNDWQQFKPTFDKDTMILPWRLTCGNGMKQVCVQVQDAASVGFPVCQTVALASKEAAFKIEFFKDAALSLPMGTYRGWPITPEGDVYFRATASDPQVLPPRFDVISQGNHLIFGQETLPLDASGGVSGFSGFSGAGGTQGIGAFAGRTAGSAFSAAAGQRFMGRFKTYKTDGIFHKDGLARVIIRPSTICDGGSDDVPATIVDPCSTQAEPAPPTASTDMASIPEPPTPLPSHTSWIATSDFLWTKLTGIGVQILPTTRTIRKMESGGVAQAFAVPPATPLGTNVDEIELRLARRRDRPSADRALTMEIVSDFDTALEQVVYSREILPEELDGVQYNPQTGLLVGASKIDPVSISVNLVLTPGTTYAIILSDYTYYQKFLLNGTDALYFLVEGGTPGSPDGITPMFTRTF